MELLFDPSLIPAAASLGLKAGYKIRPLARDDISRGVLDVLGVLTTVGSISPSRFSQQFDFWKSMQNTYFTLVVVNGNDRIVGCGSIVVERKLIHECGLVGHIEDIAVARDQQGLQLGKRVIAALTAIGQSQGCYKVILDCDEKNVGFYEKCGYSRHGVEMVCRL